MSSCDFFESYPEWRLPCGLPGCGAPAGPPAGSPHRTAASGGCRRGPQPTAPASCRTRSSALHTRKAGESASCGSHGVAGSDDGLNILEMPSCCPEPHPDWMKSLEHGRQGRPYSDATCMRLLTIVRTSPRSLPTSLVVWPRWKFSSRLTTSNAVTSGSSRCRPNGAQSAYILPDCAGDTTERLDLQSWHAITWSQKGSQAFKSAAPSSPPGATKLSAQLLFHLWNQVSSGLVTEICYLWSACAWQRCLDASENVIAALQSSSSHSWVQIRATGLVLLGVPEADPQHRWSWKCVRTSATRCASGGALERAGRVADDMPAG